MPASCCWCCTNTCGRRRPARPAPAWTSPLGCGVGEGVRCGACGKETQSAHYTQVCPSVSLVRLPGPLGRMRNLRAAPQGGLWEEAAARGDSSLQRAALPPAIATPAASLGDATALSTHPCCATLFTRSLSSLPAPSPYHGTTINTPTRCLSSLPACLPACRSTSSTPLLPRCAAACAQAATPALAPACAA